MARLGTMSQDTQCATQWAGEGMLRSPRPLATGRTPAGASRPSFGSSPPSGIAPPRSRVAPAWCTCRGSLRRRSP